MFTLAHRTVNIVPPCSTASRLGFAETLWVRGLDAVCARQADGGYVRKA
jgi:hypothetical protein